MTIKTAITEVSWGDVRYSPRDLIDVSISLNKDGSSNNCTIKLQSNVKTAPKGSPIQILIYYAGSPYEFSASFTHVGTEYSVGNEQYLEITGGSIVWNSSNQTLKNEQYYSGSPQKNIPLKDFLITFAKEKFKKDVIWQAKDSDKKEFNYTSQNGETDLAFFQRTLKAYDLEWREEGEKIVIIDLAQPVKKEEDRVTSNATVPRAFYLDVGAVQTLTRSLEPSKQKASSTSSTSDIPDAANNANKPTETGITSNVDINNASSASNTSSDVLSKLQPLTNFKNAAAQFINAPWKNDQSLVIPALKDVARQLQCNPVDLMTLGCFESNWIVSNPNNRGCLGLFQCCPSSNFCTYGSAGAVKSSGLIGQIYAIGYLLRNTTGYSKVPKPIPFINLYAGILAGDYFKLGAADGNQTTANNAMTNPRMKVCREKAEKFFGGKTSAFDNVSVSGSGSVGNSSNSSEDTMPFKIRLTVHMFPRFCGMKVGDLLIVPTDSYVGTEDFLVESVNYNKNGSGYDLQIAGGRPASPAKLAKEEVYTFAKKFEKYREYIKYLWGA